MNNVQLNTNSDLAKTDTPFKNLTEITVGTIRAYEGIEPSSVIAGKMKYYKNLKYVAPMPENDNAK